MFIACNMQFSEIQGLSENGLHHIVDGFHVDEGQAFDVDFLDVLDILAVVFGNDDGVDAGAFGGENLFLDASHRQHTSTEGHFSGHGDSASDLLATEG